MYTSYFLLVSSKKNLCLVYLVLTEKNFFFHNAIEIEESIQYLVLGDHLHFGKLFVIVIDNVICSYVSKKEGKLVGMIIILLDDPSYIT